MIESWRRRTHRPCGHGPEHSKRCGAWSRTRLAMHRPKTYAPGSTPETPRVAEDDSGPWTPSTVQKDSCAATSMQLLSHWSSTASPDRKSTRLNSSHVAISYA